MTTLTTPMTRKWRPTPTFRPLGLALLPLIVLIAVIIGLSSTGRKNVVYIGMVCGIIASIICFFKYLPSLRDTLGKGAVTGVGPAVFHLRCCGRWAPWPPLRASRSSMRPSSTCPAAPACPLPPWLRLGGIMGSGSGAVGIIAQNFLEPYLATGVDPAALAKIIATSATIGGALLTPGAMFGMLAAMGLNHKNSYKHIAAISIGAGMCALVVMIILGQHGHLLGQTAPMRWRRAESARASLRETGILQACLPPPICACLVRRSDRNVSQKRRVRSTKGDHHVLQTSQRGRLGSGRVP